MQENKIDKIINLIIKDIKDRKGVGDEFQQIDDDIIEEIKQTWKDIIINILNN